MKINSNIIKVFILFLSIIMIYNIKGYCTADGTKRMEITGGDPWLNITISEAYEECESLNSTTSTLGTSNLKAHLTTDTDWSIMAIFSISQYGATTSNTPTSTTANESGVYNPGRKYTYTTGILNTATVSNANTGVRGLFNEDGSFKYSNYTRQWSPVRTENNFVGFKDITEGGTYGLLNNYKYFGDEATFPISVKIGLFGVGCGQRFMGWAGVGGTKSELVTFRPVIWN